MRLILPAAASLAALFSCLPTDVCGCSPAMAGAVLVASVRTEAGAPVGGASVLVEGSVPSASVNCATASYSYPLAGGASLADGFAVLPMSANPGEQCIRVSAQSPGDGVEVLSDTLPGMKATFRMGVSFDTVKVNLILH